MGRMGGLVPLPDEILAQIQLLAPRVAVGLPG
jgi:hypothetical protein